MIKKTNKKGFTLAELLIVVAIIAVLVAIAVPLFVGALNNAKEKTFDANVRSLRGLAVSQILANSNDSKIALTDGNNCWECKGYWTADGKLTLTSIKPSKLTTSESETSPKETDYTAFKAFTKFGKEENGSVSEQVTLIVTPADVDNVKLGIN